MRARVEMALRRREKNVTLARSRARRTRTEVDVQALLRLAFARAAHVDTNVAGAARVRGPAGVLAVVAKNGRDGHGIKHRVQLLSREHQGYA